MKPPVTVSRSRRQALPSSLRRGGVAATLRRRRPEHGDDGCCASAGRGRAIADRDCGRREQQWPWMQRRPARLAATRNVAQAQAVPATPSSCEAKAEGGHGSAAAMALDAAAFSNCCQGPSASTHSAYFREGKAEAGRQGRARALAMGAAPSCGPRRYSDCRILGSAHPTPSSSLIKIIRRWLPWAQ